MNIRITFMINSTLVYKTYIVKFIVFLILCNCLGFVKIVEKKNVQFTYSCYGEIKRGLLHLEIVKVNIRWTKLLI